VFVVVDVQHGNGDPDAGVLLEQLCLELLETVAAARAQRQVAALAPKSTGPARAEPAVIKIFCRVTPEG